MCASLKGPSDRMIQRVPLITPEIPKPYGVDHTGYLIWKDLIPRRAGRDSKEASEQ